MQLAGTRDVSLVGSPGRCSRTLCCPTAVLHHAGIMRSKEAVLQRAFLQQLGMLTVIISRAGLAILRP